MTEKAKNFVVPPKKPKAEKIDDVNGLYAEFGLGPVTSQNSNSETKGKKE